jgi:hypothetical protein
MSIFNGNEDGAAGPSRDDFRHGKVVIKAGMFPADS